jgi:MFS transporter, Spinster family, sphingosine-1-phosphate transporter
MVGYMTTSVVFAVLANVVKPNILVSTGLTTWCIAVLATAGALNYPMLLIARAFVGVGEASFITLAPVFIDDYAPLKVKNIYLAVFYIALPVGTAIGYLYGGVVGYLLDWRVAFLGEAFIMAPFVVCVIFIPPLKKHDSKAAAMFKSLRGILIMFYRLISNPLFDLMSFGYAMFTFSVGALLVWGVTYITTVLHLDLLIASAMFSILSLVSGIIGTALGGLVVDFAGRYFERFKNPMTIFVCVILVAAAIPFGFAAVWTDSAIFFFALITVFTTLLLATTAPVNAALLHAVTPELRPLAMAGSVLSIHLLGDVPSPILFGFIVDSTGNFKLAMYFLMAVLFLTVIAWGGACVVAEVKRRVQDQQYQEPQLVLFEMGEGAGDGEEEDDTDADANANAAVNAEAGHPHEGSSSQTVHAVSVEQHQHQHHHLHELEHALDGFFSASFPETSPVILLAQTGEEVAGGNRKISQATVPAHVQSSRGGGGGGGDYVNPFEGHPSIRGGPENQEASTHGKGIGMEAVAAEEEEERKIGGI